MKKNIAKALYGFTKFQNKLKGVKAYSIYSSNDGIDSDYMSKNTYKKIEGYSQQVYYFLSRLKANELTVFALRYVWDLTAEQSNDIELNYIKKDLFLELAYHYNKRSEFSIQSIFDKFKATKTVTASDSNQLPKYDKTQKQKEEVLTSDKKKAIKHSKYAFTDILDEANFKALFSGGQLKKKEQITRHEYDNSLASRLEVRKRKKRGAVALGIDSILVYAPYYIKIFDGKVAKVDHLTSKKNQIRLTDLLLKNAKLANLEAILLSHRNLSVSDVEAFDELLILSDWMSQQNRFGGSLLMKSFNQNQVDAIVKKYGVKHLLFTGVASLRRNKTHWLYWSILFDLTTGQYTIIKKDYYKKKDTKAQLNAHLFDALFQIKSKPKKVIKTLYSVN